MLKASGSIYAKLCKCVAKLLLLGLSPSKRNRDKIDSLIKNMITCSIRVLYRLVDVWTKNMLRSVGANVSQGRSNSVAKIILLDVGTGRRVLEHDVIGKGEDGVQSLEG